MRAFLIDALSGLSVLAAVLLAVTVFAASLIPWLLLVEAERLMPRCVRELPVTVAALLMLLTAHAPEATR